MNKVTILALHLGYGGVEKAVANLANILKDDYEVEIISVYRLYDKPIFNIDKKVKIKYLLEDIKPNREELKLAIRKFNMLKIIKESYKSIKCLYFRRNKMLKEIKNCNSDIIISTRYLFNNWVGDNANKNIFKIAWEHNHPHGNKKYENKVINSCNKMDNLVLVSNNLTEHYSNLFKQKKTNCKCFYIPNTLENNSDEVSNLTEKRLISIGRLSPEKGYNDLIDIFYELHKKKSDWHLDIIGDGKEKDKLLKKIHEYKIDNYITLHGYQKPSYINSLLKKSSIYLMTSFTESFGIVLIEAMNYGIPCIAFDSAEGANEIIINNFNGFLVSNRNKDDMINKIVKLIDDENLRNKMGKNAKKNSTEFNKINVKEKWINLLK